METEHCGHELGVEDMLDVDACTIATEDNVDVQVGHDAFLLELPQKPGGKVGEADSQRHHHFVLALPEMLPSRARLMRDNTMQTVREQSTTNSQYWKGP